MSKRRSASHGVDASAPECSDANRPGTWLDILEHWWPREYRLGFNHSYEGTPMGFNNGECTFSWRKKATLENEGILRVPQ